LSIVLLAWVQPAFAQQPATTDDESVIRKVIEDMRYVATAPARMNRSAALRLLVLSGATVGLMYGLDETIDEEYAIEGGEGPLGLAGAAADVGEIYDAPTVNLFVLGTTGTLLVSGLALNDRKLIKTAGLVFEAFAFGKLITQVGKLISGRSRPFRDVGARDFSPFRLTTDSEKRSLPSGHTSSVFALTTVLAKQYPRWWVRLPAYTFASCVGLQRMESRNHWASDVFVGGTIGYVVGSCLVERHGDSGEPGVGFGPAVVGGRAGASLSLSF
jgi:hypothetical protein